MGSVSQDNGPVQRQTRLRAVPFNELVNCVSVPALGIGTRKAVQDRNLGMFKIGKPQNSSRLLSLVSGTLRLHGSVALQRHRIMVSQVPDRAD
jgi:hypothetical protein